MGFFATDPSAPRKLGNWVVLPKVDIDPRAQLETASWGILRPLKGQLCTCPVGARTIMCRDDGPTFLVWPKCQTPQTYFEMIWVVIQG